MRRLANLALVLTVLLPAVFGTALLVEGCGPKHRKYYDNSTHHVATIGSLSVIYYGGEISADQRAACEAAIAAVVSEWEACEPVPVPTLQVEVLVDQGTECGNGTAGCALLERGRVQVVAWYPGYEWSCPALYHELAHAAYKLRGHKDSRWGDWTPRGWRLGVKWARGDLPAPKKTP